MSTTIDLDRLRIGERVTMRYPNGMLQEAILVDNDAGILNFQFGRFSCNCVGTLIDIFRDGRGEWSVGPHNLPITHIYRPVLQRSSKYW